MRWIVKMSVQSADIQKDDQGKDKLVLGSVLDVYVRQVVMLRNADGDAKTISEHQKDAFRFRERSAAEVIAAQVGGRIIVLWTKPEWALIKKGVKPSELSS